MDDIGHGIPVVRQVRNETIARSSHHARTVKVYTVTTNRDELGEGTRGTEDNTGPSAFSNT